MSEENNISQLLRQYNIHRQTIVTACQNSQKLKSSLEIDLTDIGPNALRLIDQIGFSSLENILNSVHVCSKSRGKPEYEQTIKEKLNDHTSNEEINEILKDLSLDAEIQELRKPCIAVVGQTKAGKSSLVNCLLEKLVVSQAQTRATVRMTHLHYSKIKYVAEKRAAEQSLVAFHLREHEQIPEEYLGVQFSGAQRSNPEIIGVEIHAGLESDLLESGLKIVDSPGLNENKELNNLLKDLMSSQLPLVIYVISGQKSLTAEDIKDIREMKEQNEDLQIIYFVTKLDMTKANKRDNPDKDPVEEAENRLQRVFDSLQKNGLLSSGTTRQECPEFHGASLISMMPTLRSPFTLSDNDDCMRFKRFRECLFQKAEMYLYHNIMKAANDLSLVLQQTLHVIINHASELDRNQETIKDIQKREINDFRTAELEIYETIKERVTESNKDMRDEFINMLRKQEQRTEDILKTFKYSRSLEEQVHRGPISKEIIESCKREINRAIAVTLDSEIQYFLEHNIIPRETSNEDVLKKLSGSDKLLGQTSLFKLLECRLKEKYELHEYEMRKKPNKLKRMKKAMKKKLTDLKKLFDKQSGIESINPNSEEWKKEQALGFQCHFDVEKFADEYFHKLEEDLEERHQSFVSLLNGENQTIEEDLQLTSKEKDVLKDYPPKFAALYTRCLDIIGDYDFPDSSIKQISTLGKGGQGVVHKCLVKGEEIARKTCRFKNFESAALEIYFFSLFSHPNLQKLRGIRLKKPNQLIQFLDLAKYDCKEYLACERPTLDKRVDIAIQICHGIKCIHDQGIMHRDLKLENVLIDDNFNAIVTDFGYCKPEAFAKTLAGTPIHMAPEVISSTLPYKKSADIYSFGILFWYLIDATGDHPDYIQQESIETPYQALDATRKGLRPEIKDEFPRELSAIMTQCWDADPAERPQIDDIIKALVKFKESLP